MAKEFTDRTIQTDFDNAFKMDPTREIMERGWFRNILYYMGEQWLFWFAEQNTFGRRYELNTNIPTPVSNIIRDYVRAMKALTMNKNYTTTVWPNSQEQEDKDAAELGISVLDWMNSLDEGAIEDTKELVELWRLLTGNGFARTFASIDTGEFVMGPDMQPVVGKGDVVTECLIPFNVVTSSLGSTPKAKDYVGIKSLKQREWVEDTFKVQIKHGDSTMELDYQKQLMTLVANVSPWKGRGIENITTDLQGEDLVLYKELEYRPTKDFPEGRYAVICNGQVIRKDEKMPIPVDRESGNWEYTVTHFPYDHTPGSFWSTAGVDDLISPQNTINHIDQALETNRDSLGRPMVITPSEVTIKRLSSRAQGLISVAYDARTAMGARPVVHQGVAYPDQVLKERDIHKGVAQDAAGDPKNVLRGQSPHSGASGIMVDILRETAEQGHAPDIRRFYRAWNRVDRKRLIIAQTLYTENRTLKMKGKGNEILVRQFKGSDLRNNVDVRLELDSGPASTNVGKSQFLLGLVKEGFWGEVSANPQVQRELLRRFGMGGFPEEDNLHRDRAELENSSIGAGDFKHIASPGVPEETEMDEATGEEQVTSWHVEPTMDPVFRVDNHLVHLQVHDQLILSREFLELSEKIQAVAVAHRIMHHEAWLVQQEEMIARQSQEEAEGNAGEGGEAPTASGGGQGAQY